MLRSPATAKPSREANQSAAASTPQPMPCYLIGMPDGPERWQPTIAAMEELGLQVRLWPAVDGRQGLPALQSGERIVSRFRLWMLGLTPLSGRELGCFLSHYRLLQHCHDAGYPRFAVFEDDTFPNSHLPRVLEAIASLDDSYAIVHLDPFYPRFYIQKLARQAKRSNTSTNEMMLWPAAPQRSGDGLCGTQGLVFHRRIVPTLLDRLMPIYTAYDMQLLSHTGTRPWLSLLDPPAIHAKNIPSTVNTGLPRSQQLRIKPRFLPLKWIRNKVWAFLRILYLTLNRHWESRLRRQLGPTPPPRPLGPIHPHE